MRGNTNDVFYSGVDFRSVLYNIPIPLHHMREIFSPDDFVLIKQRPRWRKTLFAVPVRVPKVIAPAPELRIL